MKLTHGRRGLSFPKTGTGLFLGYINKIPFVLLLVSISSFNSTPTLQGPDRMSNNMLFFRSLLNHLGFDFLLNHFLGTSSVFR